MPNSGLSSSEYIRRLQNRVVYADYLVQQKQYADGCLKSTQLSSGAGSHHSSGTLTSILEGSFQTTDAERSTIQLQNECPVVPIPIRMLVLMGSNYAETATAISNRLLALGITNATITSVQLTNIYTGSAITTANYNVVLYATNGIINGAGALSTNLKNYVEQGGHLITGVSVWSLYPSGFDFMITPFQVSNTLTAALTITMNTVGYHPITFGIANSLSGAGTLVTNGALVSQSGTTVIATLASNGNSLIGIRTVGTSRLVGLNCDIYTATSYTNLVNLLGNIVLWCVRRI